MKIETDKFGDFLYVDGEKVGEYEYGDDAYFVAASRLKGFLLSDLPKGVSIKLCDRIIGSDDVFPREPNCTFEHSDDNCFLAHVETAFFPDSEDIDPTACRAFLNSSLEEAKRALEPLKSTGLLITTKQSIHEEIAYLEYTLLLPDQPIIEAESFVSAIESRINDGVDRPLLFICHASEDETFVERLVAELDRRALYAWFDKREILVGDSIVVKINAALTEARYLVAVLSPNSVKKPWVTRELNSTLMRQLDEQNIRILPIILSDCEIPPLLSDLKYADFRSSFDEGFSDLFNAIRLK